MKSSREALAERTLQTNYEARRASRTYGPAALEKRGARGEPAVSYGGREWETCARSLEEGIGEVG